MRYVPSLGTMALAAGLLLWSLLAGGCALEAGPLKWDVCGFSGGVDLALDVMGNKLRMGCYELEGGEAEISIEPSSSVETLTPPPEPSRFAGAMHYQPEELQPRPGARGPAWKQKALPRARFGRRIAGAFTSPRSMAGTGRLRGDPGVR